MRGFEPDGDLGPELDAKALALIGEIADEGDLVGGYLIVAIVQGPEEAFPSTLVAPAPGQADAVTLGLAHYAAMRVGLVSARRDSE